MHIKSTVISSSISILIHCKENYRLYYIILQSTLMLFPETSTSIITVTEHQNIMCKPVGHGFDEAAFYSCIDDVAECPQDLYNMVVLAFLETAS